MKEKRFMTAGEFARQIEIPYTTIATWLRKGQVPGAIPQTIGNFRVWMVPEEAATTLEEWRPKPGRPPLTDEVKAARAKQGAKKAIEKPKARAKKKGARAK
jgi:hypothetical protein